MRAVGGDPGVEGFPSRDGALQGLKIGAVVRSVGGFVDGRGEISGIRGLADIDEDKTIADGVVEVGGIEGDGLLAHAAAVFALLRITRIKIGRDSVGRGESRIHLNDFIEIGERVRGAGGARTRARAKHGGHVVRQIVGRILRDGLGEFGFGGLRILFGIPGEETEAFVDDGRIGIGSEGFVEDGFGFGGALGIDEKDAAQGLCFGDREENG